MPENEKQQKYLVTFPKKSLTPEQEEQLKAALRSAVVTVARDVAPGDVDVQSKVNNVNKLS